MFERIEDVKTYFPNGTLSYEAKNGILKPDGLFNHLYNARTDHNGVKRVYLSQIKYNSDGTLRWELVYGEYGDMIDCIRGKNIN